MFEKKSLTFRRVDVHSRSVQRLVVLPVVVPDDRPGTVHGEHHHQPHPWPLRPQTAFQHSVTVPEQEAVAHTGHVQYPLGQHEAHVEKHVGHRHERYGGHGDSESHGPCLKIL